ncbi:MAG TPA: flagellar biosynthetic protein FliO [Burkholderiales bacterium]|nr:flagellar biosynthetic protein FliO [Burkholderiales bacterium]
MRFSARIVPGARAALVAFPCVAHAAQEAPAAVGTGSVLQVLLGLAVVLAMVFAAAWAMRRFDPNAATGGNALRVVAGTSVGSRERVVVLELDDTWLVVGVAPGRVSSLHNMPKPQNFQAAAQAMPASPFANWLKQTLEKRKHG